MYKTQLIYVHGGMTFSTDTNYEEYLNNIIIKLEETPKWNKNFFDDQLKEHFDIIRPSMPLKDNAKYKYWKIMFEKYLEVTKENIIIVGFSLGGIFLAKYLSENIINKNILGVFLVAPPFGNFDSIEELCGGFELKKDLSNMKKNCNNIHMFFSKDDDIVPQTHMKDYQKNLPNANYHLMENMNGHFIIEEFKELIDLIIKLK